VNVLEQLCLDLEDVKARLVWLEKRINEYKGDTWKCQAELPLESGHVLHCTEKGTHTTHRFSIEV
jgi:hypothetical protein